MTRISAVRETGHQGRPGLMSRVMACLLLIVLAPTASAGLADTHRAFGLGIGSSITRVVLQFDPVSTFNPASWSREEAAAANLIVPARPFSLSFAGPAASSRFLATDCLTAAIYYEAANEPVVGQRAVAQVVLNRLKHPAYPNTVCGVVFQGSERTTGCQFTFTCDGSLERRPLIGGWLQARAIASAALSGYVEQSVGHATHYHAVYVAPYWAVNLVKLDTIASHIFYQWPGRAGTAAAFMQPYGGVEAMPHAAVSSLSSYMLAAPFGAIAEASPLPGSQELENSFKSEDLDRAFASRNAALMAAVDMQASRTGVAVSTSRLALPETRLKDDLARNAIIANQPALLE